MERRSTSENIAQPGGDVDGHSAHLCCLRGHVLDDDCAAGSKRTPALQRRISHALRLAQVP